MRIILKKPKEFPAYEQKLLEMLGENMFNLLAAQECFLAGGAITSLFSDTEINDFDIYLPNKDALRVIVTFLFREEEI